MQFGFLKLLFELKRFAKRFTMLIVPTYDLLQANGRNTIVSKAISEKLVATYGVEKCVGNAGDIFILNTKNLHWAGKLSAGTRELLWLYY